MAETVADENLMARYAAGDARAFDELFRRYESRAYTYFLRRTGSPERARDLYQTLFLRVHRARNAYDPRRPFPPWFFEIARRLVIDEIRRRFRAREVLRGDLDHEAGARADEHPRADLERIEEILRDLSSDERYVLLTAKVVGVGYPAIAAELGRSVVAVRKMASRAMQRLRVAAGLPSDEARPDWR